LGGWGGVGKIVIPMPEALSFAESRRQKLMLVYVTNCWVGGWGKCHSNV
jgi:hypothetical protein